MKTILLTAIISALATPAYADKEFINGLYSGAFETTSCDAAPKELYYKNPGNATAFEVSFKVRGTINTGGLFYGQTARSVSPLKITVMTGLVENDSFDWLSAEIINPNATLTINTNDDLKIIISDNDCENAKNLAYDISVRPQADLQTVAGTVKNTAKLAVANARVTFYTTTGAYVADRYTDERGIYSLDVPKGGYVIEFASYDGKTGIYNGSAPFDKASRIIIGDKKVTANATLDTTQPAISGMAPATVAGKSGYIITGAGFGSSRGYVDLGGYATNSSTYIKSWTDTQIELVRSSTMPITSNCLRVFSKTAGYSDCIAY